MEIKSSEDFPVAKGKDLCQKANQKTPKNPGALRVFILFNMVQHLNTVHIEVSRNA